jgi:hypothetical protein
VALTYRRNSDISGFYNVGSVYSRQVKSSAIINVTLQAQWTLRFSTYVGYQGELGRDRYNVNAVTGGLSFTF